jgi:hypothetical protein
MPEQLNIGNVPAFPDKTMEELQSIVDNPDADKYARETASTQIKMIKNREELGYDSWYDWCCDQWGTKWNIKDYSSDWENITPEKAQLRYLSAWSPPNGALLKGSNLFPELKITNVAMDYAMDWICESTFENGVMNDECFRLSSSPDLVSELFGDEPYEEEDEGN